MTILEQINDYLNEAKNPFALYDEVKGWEEASAAIQKAADKADKTKFKYLDDVDDSPVFGPLLKKYKKYGATDTMSREAIVTYIQRKK